jgi:chromatin segregation and condensation protein Rec8/ScpA/Scc1 (kleisin family)
MIVSLLAVLELVRLQAIVLVQQEMFGKIWLRKHKMFEVAFAGGESISESLADSLREIDQQYPDAGAAAAPQREDQ